LMDQVTVTLYWLLQIGTLCPHARVKAVGHDCVKHLVRNHFAANCQLLLLNSKWRVVVRLLIHSLA
jgi:hypothetical protein